jgi:Tfp pilus assembly protein PilO
LPLKTNSKGINDLKTKLLKISDPKDKMFRQFLSKNEIDEMVKPINKDKTLKWLIKN